MSPTVPNGTKTPKYRKGEKQPKKQRLLSGQNDSFTRSDISTETTSTNTSYSQIRANQRKNPKQKKTPSRSSLSSNLEECDSNHVGSTPLAELNELLQRQGKAVAHFEEQGIQLMPPFTVVCLVEELDLRTEARGTSKKDAKHKAAADMLDLVRSSVNGESNPRLKIDLRQLTIDSVANPIGLAQYYTQINQEPAPTYRFQVTLQPPFKCIAELGDGRTVEGVAHRRTDAKSGAARLLLKLIKSDQLKLSSPVEQAESEPSHPVTQLQQFCHENQLFLPKYQYSQARPDGAHTCSCTLASFQLTTEETRKSQREARRAAAAVMFQMVQKVSARHHVVT